MIECDIIHQLTISFFVPGCLCLNHCQTLCLTLHLTLLAKGVLVHLSDGLLMLTQVTIDVTIIVIFMLTFVCCFSDILTTIPFVDIHVLWIIVVIIQLIHFGHLTSVFIILFFYFVIIIIIIVVIIILAEHAPNGRQQKGEEEQPLCRSKRIWTHYTTTYMCMQVTSGCGFTTKLTVTLVEHEMYYCSLNSDTESVVRNYNRYNSHFNYHIFQIGVIVWQ